MRMYYLLEVLVVLAICIGFRVLAYVLSKRQSVEVGVVPVETTDPTTTETFTRLSIWPVVALLGVIVSLVVGLMLFGNAING